MHDVRDTRPSEVAPASEVRKLRRRNRWLIAAVSVLAVVSLGLAAWAIFGEADTEPLTAEQETMLATIDAYLEAWNTGDSSAADALMDPEGYLDDPSGRWSVADGTHAEYLEMVHSLGMRFYRGETQVMGNVVLVSYEGTAPGRPGIYRMSPDGTSILWVSDI